MSESTHSTYKSEFSVAIVQHIKVQDRVMIYYNNQRYPYRLFGLTPNEVLDGGIPCRNWFKDEIIEAKRLRILENREFNVCFLLSGLYRFLGTSWFYW